MSESIEVLSYFEEEYCEEEYLWMKKTELYSDEFVDRERNISFELPSDSILIEEIISIPKKVRLPSVKQTSAKTIEETIASSRWIIELEDNWDDEGGQGYSQLTWERAISFLRALANITNKDFCNSLSSPLISHADKGSIDLFWKLEDRQLLVNVPSGSSELATYCGKNIRGETTSGSLRLEYPNFSLAVWLTCSEV